MKNDAQYLSNLLQKAKQAEQNLLVKRHKNIYHNLKKYIKYQQQIAKFDMNEN